VTDAFRRPDAKMSQNDANKSHFQNNCKKNFVKDAVKEFIVDEWNGEREKRRLRQLARESRANASQTTPSPTRQTPTDDGRARER